ncbi:MAG: recombination regulator RecX [Chlorobiaceae bacterium]|nr:recombination regulator RecX [Chlorobiaceae bacterium]
MDEKKKSAALNQALKLLATRAHSRSELEAKLKSRGFDPEAVLKAVERLEQLKLIDDRAFAGSCMESMGKRRPEGRIKTRIRLKQKGLSEEIVDEMMGSYDQMMLCAAAAEKKMRTLSGTPEAKRKKLLTFLKNRGFDWQTISQTLSQLGAPLEEQDDQEEYPELD